MWKETLQKLLALPLFLRQKRLAAERAAISEESFVKQIDSQGGDPAAARLVWMHLRPYIYADDFTPHPSDDLLAIFGLAEEDLDEDIILDILVKLGIRRPTFEKNIEFGVVNTPLRIAHYISFARDCQSEGAGMET